ncbi:MAG: hypothetical protein ACOYB4_04855, partial [Methyloceanibacter sp.]
KLVIRQEWEGKGPKESASITLSNPDELRGFFKGLRRIMASLGTVETGPAAVSPRLPPQSAPQDNKPDSEEREALVAKARARNPQAFAPWTKTEEQEVAKRYKAGESIESIAKAQKRSPRAIELRLQRLGLVSGPSET